LGDGLSFEEFYAAVFQRLVGQLCLITGSLPEAEDVVQEALTRAAGRWARLRAHDVPETWVRRVAMMPARCSTERSSWPSCRC
jgi:RNA polymerase sigma-70 factor, ECF subfamily